MPIARPSPSPTVTSVLGLDTVETRLKQAGRGCEGVAYMLIGPPKPCVYASRRTRRFVSAATSNVAQMVSRLTRIVQL